MIDLLIDLCKFFYAITFNSNTYTAFCDIMYEDYVALISDSMVKVKEII